MNGTCKSAQYQLNYYCVAMVMHAVVTNRGFFITGAWNVQIREKEDCLTFLRCSALYWIPIWYRYGERTPFFIRTNPREVCSVGDGVVLAFVIHANTKSIERLTTRFEIYSMVWLGRRGNSFRCHLINGNRQERALRERSREKLPWLFAACLIDSDCRSMFGIRKILDFRRERMVDRPKRAPDK